MGAWGLGSFENDTAGDFTDAIVADEDFAQVRSVLRNIARLPLSSYLDDDDCCEGLVAAEIVAALNGYPSPDIPEDLAVTLSKLQPHFQSGDVELAVHAVKRIRHTSELRDLVEDTPFLHFVEWLCVISDLKKRLKSPIRSVTFPEKKVKNQIPFKSGDIILIPLEENLYGIGKILLASEQYPLIMVFGLYRGLLDEKNLPNKLPSIPERVEYAWTDPVEEGIWHIVGNESVSNAEAEFLPGTDIERMEGIPLCPPWSIKNYSRQINGAQGNRSKEDEKN